MTAGLAAVLEGAVTLTLAEIIGWSVLRQGEPRPRHVAVVFAAALVIAALALDRGGPTSVGRAAARSAWLALGALVLIAAHTARRVAPLDVLGLGMSAGILALAVGGAARLLGALLGSPARGRLAVGVTLALAGTAPIWLGPAVERLGAPEAAVDALVAVSPLTYLAVMGGFDYLHQSWFYVRSPVASLRFAYPTATALTACYLAVAVLLLHADRAVAERWRRG